MRLKKLWMQSRISLRREATAWKLRLVEPGVWVPVRTMPDPLELVRKATGSPSDAVRWACLLEATMSIGIGPLIAPVLVSGRLAVEGALVSLVAVVVVTMALALRRRLDRWSGALCLALYALAYVIFAVT